MTQEKKQLLLKVLCSMLPHGVIVKYKSQESQGDIELGYGNINYVARLGTGWWKDCKPYLRSMSSMTEEEKKEHDFYCGYKLYDDNIGESYLTEYDMPDYIDFLLSHHFDFRGLIQMGLALEAPEGMYKNE